MNREDPRSLTPSTVPNNSPIPHPPQTIESTWEPRYPTGALDAISQSSLMDTINDRHKRLPPVPLFPPSNTERSSDMGWDVSFVPQPVDGVEVCLDSDDKDWIRPPAAWTNPDIIEGLKRAHERNSAPSPEPIRELSSEDMPDSTQVARPDEVPE